MPLKWEDYDIDPAANNSAPPIGAPENGVRNKQVNDIQRYMMAAIAEIGNWLQDVDDGLGSMAAQDADSVLITGGNLGGVAVGFASAGATSFAPSTINAGALTNQIPTSCYPVAPAGVPNAILFNGLTSQQWYDFLEPVGSLKIFSILKSTLPIPPNVTAVWGRIVVTESGGTDFGYDLKMMPDSRLGTDVAVHTTGGSMNATSTAAGGHTHTIQDHVLSIAEIPAHRHYVEGGAFVGGQDRGYNVGNTQQNSNPQWSRYAGGAGSSVDGILTTPGATQGHNHPITSVGSHAHDVFLNPVWFGICVWKRIS